MQCAATGINRRFDRFATISQQRICERAGPRFVSTTKFNDAYTEFRRLYRSIRRPERRTKSTIPELLLHKMKDYKKALEPFSQALLSKDSGLQGSSHYNLGNTLYQRGDAEKGDDKKLTDWTNALQHYDKIFKLQPQNKEAKENYEFVKKKIDEPKKGPRAAANSDNDPHLPTPTPSLSPQSGKIKINKTNSSKTRDKQDCAAAAEPAGK